MIEETDTMDEKKNTLIPVLLSAIYRIKRKFNAAEAINNFPLFVNFFSFFSRLNNKSPCYSNSSEK